MPVTCSATPNNSIASIAWLLGVSRSTLYKYVPELGGVRGQRSLVAVSVVDAARLALAAAPPSPASWNDNPRPFVWTKTADEILDTIAAYCQRINDSGH
jgi:hypothetical protein